jgi:hypothetical protein
MEETIGKASLGDAPIRTGIAVDKMLALTGQTPVLQIANIVLQTAEKEREREMARHNNVEAERYGEELAAWNRREKKSAWQSLSHHRR